MYGSFTSRDTESLILWIAIQPSIESKPVLQVHFLVAHYFLWEGIRLVFLQQLRILYVDQRIKSGARLVCHCCNNVRKRLRGVLRVLGVRVYKTAHDTECRGRFSFGFVFICLFSPLPFSLLLEIQILFR